MSIRTLAVSAILSLALTVSLHAQARGTNGAEATFTAGASLGDGETALALSTGLQARFASRVGSEVEILYARKLDFALDVCPPPLLCIIGGEIPVTGRLLALIPQLTVDVLPPSRRIQAYAQAGLGVGHVRQRYVVGPPFANDTTERTRSNLTLALSVGGGIVARLSPRLSVGADVRLLQLRDDEATANRAITPAGMLTTLRVGSRVGWRF